MFDRPAARRSLCMRAHGIDRGQSTYMYMTSLPEYCTLDFVHTQFVPAYGRDGWKTSSGWAAERPAENRNDIVTSTPTSQSYTGLIYTARLIDMYATQHLSVCMYVEWACPVVDHAHIQLRHILSEGLEVGSSQPCCYCCARSRQSSQPLQRCTRRQSQRCGGEKHISACE